MRTEILITGIAASISKKSSHRVGAAGSQHFSKDVNGLIHGPELFLRLVQSSKFVKKTPTTVLGQELHREAGQGSGHWCDCLTLEALAGDGLFPICEEDLEDGGAGLARIHAMIPGPEHLEGFPDLRVFGGPKQFEEGRNDLL